MTIGIYGREFNNSVIPYVQQVFDCLVEYNVEVLVYKKFFDFIKDKLFFPKGFGTFDSHHEVKAQLDVMISLGGDGTMLDTVTHVRDSGVPMIGINFGRLGFLASVNKEDIKSAIQSLVEKKFSLDVRRLLKLESDSNLFGDMNFALNDFTIHKRDNSAMMLTHCYIDGEFLNSYWADGLIVATPTGSTAYSLSCGGPIMLPRSGNLVITPISPHNLTVRPVILPDIHELTFEIETRSSKYLTTLDSRTEIIDSSVRLKVKRADFDINLIRLDNESYLSTLRNKLLWGIDTRNY
ncbi:ATP-NAD/AcoX kinase [Pseudopedobacter saltans DSM 12145]|uniref:NAD kinase n=1 Tax=Pseudopedobacter saltans (strain ATCC 51119 / DSM 12145 / JCM 21818 / CCUG 39354 / LMG 10337 / NBRC 100064 / NCIMB 13643) TaxID=762903 RepID=F0S9V3_PSESL|nr:NAD kinase [Pseudopedobacter saltans]ADY52511.1 ATP-NAD/AcoX kinase [Pseudopedobacter saltans DSM 12145]